MAKKLGLLDSLLPLWILIVMVAGILIANYVPDAQVALNKTKIIDVSLPIFIGLLWMMFPVLCKVKYEELHNILKQKENIRNLTLSLVINLILAPLLMLALAWATLPDLPEYRTGVILVGVARCIAMVLIWNELADGNTEWCAILVAFNAILQLFLFSPMAYLYTVVIGGGVGVQAVDIWLGIPLLAGILTRFTLRFALRKWLGPKWYDETFLPLIGPTSLLGLLFTILIMFILQGFEIINNIGNVFRVSIPLLLYFTIVFFSTFFMCANLKKTPYDIAVTQSFTASGNNFELAIAVAVATYGIESKEALATVVGPLIEVPVLLLLVHASLGMRGWYERKQGGRKEDVEIPLGVKVGDGSSSVSL